MQISIAFQTLVFLQAILLGVCLGAAYDLLRAIRTAAPKAGLTAVCDGVFWALVLVSGFIFVLTAAQGDGRAYIAVGALLGGVLYAITFSPLLYGACLAAFCTVRRLLRHFVVCVEKNTQRLAQFGRRQGDRIHKFLKKIMQKILSFFSKKG